MPAGKQRKSFWLAHRFTIWVNGNFWFTQRSGMLIVLLYANDTSGQVHTW